MSHHPSLTDLIAYQRGELSEEQNQKLRQHLSGCSHCTENLEMFSLPKPDRAHAETVRNRSEKAPIPCLSAEEISMFMNGELSKAEERAVQEHLATCEECRLKLAELIRASAPLARAELAAVKAQSTLAIEQQLRAIERIIIQGEPPPKIRPTRGLFGRILAPIYSLRPAFVVFVIVLTAPALWFGQKPFRHWRAEINLTQGLALLQKVHPIPDDALRPHGFPLSMFSEHHSSKELIEIKQKLQGALSWERGNREARRALALLHFFEGDTGGADSLLRALIREDERDYAAWNDLGFMAAQRTDTLAALEAFDQALHLNPECREAADNRAMLLGEK